MNETEKLKILLYAIRDELKGKIISQDIDGNYKPCKNLTKQEVYKSYVKLRKMLKAEYVFKDNETALKELLEEL